MRQLFKEGIKVDIDELKVLIATTPPGPQTIGVPPSPTRLQKAEEELGVKIPSNYRRFIELYGWLEMGGNSYLGVGFEIPKHLDLVAETKQLREEVEPRLPSHLIPVMNDGFGNYYCLDTSRMEASGNDCPVIVWYHDLSNEPSETVSKSFTEWIAANIIESTSQSAGG